MELKKVKKIPDSTKESRRKIISIFEQFMESGDEVSELTFDGNDDARYIARNLYQVAYQYKFPVKVHQRGKQIFLERKHEKDGSESGKTV